MKHSFAALLLATTMLLPASAFAQTATNAADVEAAEAGEIIVTARKREENLQEVPIAITALGAETLQASRVENLADVAKLTPGLTFTPLFGRQNQLPIIRGAAQTFGQLNVGVFLDGVYLSGKAAVDLELNDLARVEVIKRRDAFERDPEAFIARFKKDEDKTRKRIVSARERLPAVSVPDAALERTAQLCMALGTDGLRGELTVMRAARSLAALEGADTVTDAQIQRVARPALRHRLRRDPLDDTDATVRVDRVLADLFPA